jgi:septal ring factor EnvC (AmiA/AmiB activator)
LLLPCALAGNEDASLQSQLALLQKENAALRRKLDSSEALRHKGQQALHELKQEFEALHKDLMLFQAGGADLIKCGTPMLSNDGVV